MSVEVAAAPRTVVVGGTGFVGGAITQALLANGWDAAAGRRERSNTLWARKLGLPLVHADLDRVESMAEAFAGAHLVYFAAGYYPRLSHEGDAARTRALGQADRLLQAAREAGVGRVVFTSSAATIAQPEGRAGREADGAPEAAGSTYYATKIALEARLLEAASPLLEVLALCPSACLGPGDHRVGTTAPILGLLRGELEHWVDGTVDLIDVRDAAEAHVRAAYRGRSGARYLLAGHRVELGWLLRRLSLLTGCEPPGPPLSAAEGLRFASEEERAAERTGRRPRLTRQLVELTSRGLRLDATRARDELQLGCRPMDETLLDTARWFSTHGYLRRRKPSTETDTALGSRR